MEKYLTPTIVVSLVAIGVTLYTFHVQRKDMQAQWERQGADTVTVPKDVYVSMFNAVQAYGAPLTTGVPVVMYPSGVQ